MRRSPARGRALAVAGAALLVAGCGANTTSEFPVADGFKPLESQGNQLWPDLATNTLPAFTSGPGTPHGTGQSYYDAWGHAYVPYPLSAVWAALQDPRTSHIHVPSGGTVTPIPGVEGALFPLSFRIDYTSPTGIPLTPDVDWEITYRGGALQGSIATPADIDSATTPTEIGLRFQKTWGTPHIQIESGSLVASLVPNSNPPVTQVEFIDWLQADTQGQSDVEGTVNDMYNNLVFKLANPTKSP